MSRTILVADDEPQVRRTLSRALEDEATRVVEAGDGSQALALVGAEAPDLILLDIRMPAVSGWDVLARLRQDLRTRSIPVIMLTGCCELVERVGGLKLGADDYLTKPVALEELRARVECHLRRSERDLSANPLTRLPGSPAVEAEVTRRIRDKEPFAFFYIDIDHFKPYNDAYGYAEGDKVILTLADLLVDCLAAECGAEGFAGHIGGDDFTALCSPAHAPFLAQSLVSRFDACAPGFYKAADRERGFIVSTDRRGRYQRYGFLTLTAGIVTTERRRLDHYAKVVQIASEMKSYFKSRPAGTLSRFAFDRRTDSPSEAKA